MKPLAENFDIAYRSPDPKKDFPYSPSILIIPETGRYVLSYDISDRYGEIRVSDDKGKTWTKKAERKFCHARVFRDGNRLYVLGHKKDLVIFYSDDFGDTWSEEFFLTQGETWNGCAAGVWYKDEYVYMAMDAYFLNEGETMPSFWNPNIIAPTVLRGKLGTDLTKRENWLFSEKVRFRDVIKEEEIKDIGVPFFPTQATKPQDEDCTYWPPDYRKAYNFEEDKPGIKFHFHLSGWLEANIVQITDPKHYWYDKTGKTFHIFMRANTGATGYGCVMKAVERTINGKDVITVECVTNPSGKRVVFLPFPGGQMKFYIKYDEKTKLYWLASSQARDSMTRIEYLSEDRFNVPCDERDRLVLHFSKNLVDWCFAGLVDQSGADKQSRHYASMDIDGDDLIIVSRSGDKDAHSAHDGNILSVHRVKNFRDLVY